jgi:prevent-host-death family protein
MDKIIPISDLQTKAKQYVEQVKETDQPVVITQRGRAAAVLVSYESYEGFLATRDE